MTVRNARHLNEELDVSIPKTSGRASGCSGLQFSKNGLQLATKPVQLPRDFARLQSTKQVRRTTFKTQTTNPTARRRTTRTFETSPLVNTLLYPTTLKRVVEVGERVSLGKAKSE